jgi:hypothetical protein
MHRNRSIVNLIRISEYQRFFGKSKAGSPVLGSRNNSKSQYTQCQIAAKKHIPDKTICDNATPSKLQRPGFDTLSPVILQPPHESVIPRRVMKGITYLDATWDLKQDLTDQIRLIRIKPLNQPNLQLKLCA